MLVNKASWGMGRLAWASSEALEVVGRVVGGNGPATLFKQFVE